MIVHLPARSIRQAGVAAHRSANRPIPHLRLRSGTKGVIGRDLYAAFYALRIAPAAKQSAGKIARFGDHSWPACNSLKDAPVRDPK